MSSFTTQRLANAFPIHTRIRRDPSSMGQRMLSVFGEAFDFLTAEKIKVIENYNIFKLALGIPWVWYLDLEEGDYLQTSMTDAGLALLVDPTSVVGNDLIEGPLVLTRDEYIQDLLFGTPTRIHLETPSPIPASANVWDSSVRGTYGAIDYPERLELLVENTTNWLQLNENGFDGAATALLHGYDQNGNEFWESILIPDEGYFVSENIFSELLDVQITGVEGDLVLRQMHHGKSFLRDRYRVAITDSYERPLGLEYDQVTVDGNDATALVYYADVELLGRLYRENGENFGNKEILAKEILRDSTSNHYQAQDFALNPDDGRLYVLDAANYLHIHDIDRPQFMVPAIAETLTVDCDIVLIPINHYVLPGQDIILYTRHQRMHSLVSKVCIKRYLPGVGTPEYWNASTKSWSGTLTYVSGLASATSPNGSWDDIRVVSNTNDIGQIDFVIEVYAGDYTQVSCVSVMQGANDALVSFDTGEANTVGLFWGCNGKLKLVTTTEILEITLKRDTYLADLDNQRLYFREQYDSVEVTI